jgi:hypothetical protein
MGGALWETTKVLQLKIKLVQQEMLVTIDRM